MGLVQGGELCRLQRRPVTLGSSEVGADGGSEVDRERQFGLLLEEWTMVVLIRVRERGREAGEAVHGAKLMTGGSALEYGLGDALVREHILSILSLSYNNEGS